MKVKVTLMSAVEPEMRRMSFGDNPDFGDFKKKVSELFNETDTEMLFQWKGKTDKTCNYFTYDFSTNEFITIFKKSTSLKKQIEISFALERE